MAESHVREATEAESKALDELIGQEAPHVHGTWYVVEEVPSEPAEPPEEHDPQA